jgi:hypothetical protein
VSLDVGELHATKLGLLGCVAAQIAVTPEGAPDRACVVPGGEVAWDDCECGQLTVHHTAVYPSRSFPEPDLAAPFTKCDPPFWVAEVVITMVRCVPHGDGENPPSCEGLEAAAAVQDRDIEAMQMGVTCCLAGQFHQMRDHLTLGPSGACSGSELHVLVGFGNCPVEC